MDQAYALTATLESLWMYVQETSRDIARVEDGAIHEDLCLVVLSSPSEENRLYHRLIY